MGFPQALGNTLIISYWPFTWRACAGGTQNKLSEEMKMQQFRTRTRTVSGSALIMKCAYGKLDLFISGVE